MLYAVVCCYLLYVYDMLYACCMSSDRGELGLGYMLFIAHLCNHILRQSGGGTWGTALHTVRGVGSGSRDVDAWTQTSLYAEDRGPYGYFC